MKVKISGGRRPQRQKQNFGHCRSHRCGQFRAKIFENGAILIIFRPFFIFRQKMQIRGFVFAVDAQSKIFTSQGSLFHLINDKGLNSTASYYKTALENMFKKQ